MKMGFIFARRGGILKELINDRQKLNGEMTHNRPRCCDIVDVRPMPQMPGFIKDKYVFVFSLIRRSGENSGA